MNAKGIWLGEADALRVVNSVLVDPIVGSPASQFLENTGGPPIACLETESTAAGVYIALGKKY
jgi:hypothetical protein